MRRRSFITFLGSRIVMGSLTAYAQQSGSRRRIGVLMSYPETDPDGQAFLAAFREELQKLGWIEGRPPFSTARLGALIVTAETKSFGIRHK